MFWALRRPRTTHLPATKRDTFDAAGVMEIISRVVFGLASLVLMLIAIALSIYSAGLIVHAVAQGWDKTGGGLLTDFDHSGCSDQDCRRCGFEGVERLNSTDKRWYD